jgi:phage-related minor tail protein
VIDGRTAAELRWFFIAAPGELGLTSNFGAMVSQLSAFGSRGGGAVAIDERKLHAAERARRIEQRLSKCTTATQRVLRRAFSVWDEDQSVVEFLLHNTWARDQWRTSKTNKSMRGWLERLRDTARHDTATGMKWLKLKREALSCIGIAVAEF